MTNEEAIKQLEELIDDRKSFCEGDDEHDETYRSDIEALRRAVTALDVRTPKKPVQLPFSDPDDLCCPQCGSMQRAKNDTISYCVWCGQAIKWEVIK